MVANIEDPDSLDPHKTIMATASSIQGWIYDTLFYIGEDGLPHGLLAESWTVSDDSKVITVQLGEGRMFHDGTPVNAAAVEHTFKRMLDPGTAAPAKDQVGPLEDVRATDEYTVEFIFSEPYAPFYFAASGSYLGIISPTSAEEQGEDFGRSPVGSGPFMFDEWKAGQEIRLVRNPDYVNVREDRLNQGAPYNEYVTAAQALGSTNWRIMTQHILPNVLPSIIVLASLDFPGAVLSTAALSFVGLGAQPPAAEWGYLLTGARSYIRTAPWLVNFPGLAIFVTVLGFNLLGNALRDALDPKLRAS